MGRAIKIQFASYIIEVIYTSKKLTYPLKNAGWNDYVPFEMVPV